MVQADWQQGLPTYTQEHGALERDVRQTAEDLEVLMTSQESEKLFKVVESQEK